VDTTSETEMLLRRYEAEMRRRRELADILRDEDGWLDAAEREGDARLAIELVRAGLW